ncbi:MAG: Hsp20/alpha crystallin family protein [Candidatus Diapherotrites archaeon]
MDLDVYDSWKRRKLSPFLDDDFFSDLMRPMRMRVNEFREPLIDVVDKGSYYELTAELPGVSKDGLNVEVDENGVSIEAEQKHALKKEDREKGHYYSERSYSKFLRRIPLSEEINPNMAEAEMKNGILSIKLEKIKPSHEKEKKVKVEVK